MFQHDHPENSTDSEKNSNVLRMKNLELFNFCPNQLRIDGARHGGFVLCLHPCLGGAQGKLAAASAGMDDGP